MYLAHVSYITFMHLADAFIQSDLQCIQNIIFFYQYVCSLGIEPTTFCAANAMLYHWATGTSYSIFVHVFYLSNRTDMLYTPQYTLRSSNWTVLVLKPL